MTPIPGASCSRATRCAPNATPPPRHRVSRRSRRAPNRTTTRTITSTRPPTAWTATCRAAPTWAWTSAATTVSACRAPICHSPTAHPTPAMAATRIGTLLGRTRRFAGTAPATPPPAPPMCSRSRPAAISMPNHGSPPRRKTRACLPSSAAAPCSPSASMSSGARRTPSPPACEMPPPSFASAPWSISRGCRRRPASAPHCVCSRIH